MRLFTKLFEDNLISEFQHQFEPLLRRFCLMEAVAAIKFVNEQPINDPDREKIILSSLRTKCIEHGLGHEKIIFIQDYFKENMIISKLIQEAVMNSLQHSSKTEAYQYALHSISKITSKDVNKNNLLEIVRRYIDELTDQIILSLSAQSDMTNYTILEQMLMNCFGNINKTQLHTSIIHLGRVQHALLNRAKLHAKTRM